MNSEEGSRRDEVFRGEKARKGCHCPVAPPPASAATSPWTCRSYRSSRSWCRRPDAGQRPDSEVCVRILWPIKLPSQPLIVSEDKDLNQCNEDKIKSTWPNIILGERYEESLVECIQTEVQAGFQWISSLKEVKGLLFYSLLWCASLWGAVNPHQTTSLL